MAILLNLVKKKKKNWYISFGLCVRLWDRSWQCRGITVGMERPTMLVDCVNNFDNATLQ